VPGSELGPEEMQHGAGSLLAFVGGQSVQREKSESLSGGVAAVGGLSGRRHRLHPRFVDLAQQVERECVRPRVLRKKRQPAAKPPEGFGPRARMAPREVARDHPIPGPLAGKARGGPRPVGREARVGVRGSLFRAVLEKPGPGSDLQRSPMHGCLVQNRGRRRLRKLRPIRDQLAPGSFGVYARIVARKLARAVEVPKASATIVVPKAQQPSLDVRRRGCRAALDPGRQRRRSRVRALQLSLDPGQVGVRVCCRAGQPARLEVLLARLEQLALPLVRDRRLVERGQACLVLG
jgi:hypothetical protein